MLISRIVSEVLFEPSVQVTLKLYLPVATGLEFIKVGIVISLSVIDCCLTPAAKEVEVFE